MTERLKQIWGGFESVTARRLTGRGVDNLAAPIRRDGRAASDEAQEGLPAPAAIAFEALKGRLAAKDKKASRRRLADDTAPPDIALAPETEAARDLIRGLKATEARLQRSERLYGDVAPAPQKRGLFGGGAKKRFVLF